MDGDWEENKMKKINMQHMKRSRRKDEEPKKQMQNILSINTLSLAGQISRH